MKFRSMLAGLAALALVSGALVAGCSSGGGKSEIVLGDS